MENLNLYFDIADDLKNYNNFKKNNNPYVFGLNHSLRGLELFTASCRSNRKHNWETVNYSTKESY